MISILLPVYNGIEFIHDSIHSVIAQSFADWELIVGVNGHCANSATFNQAKQYETVDARIKVVDLPHIKGKSNALNEMLGHCSYQFVALLDVDDMWYCRKLMTQSQFLADYDVVGSNCMYFGDATDIVPVIPIGDITSVDFFIRNPVINSSSIIRKDLCHWNSVFDGIEDYDLWLRLRAQNKRFYNCHEILVKHRIHTSSAFNAVGNHLKVPDLLEHHRLLSGRKTRETL